MKGGIGKAISLIFLIILVGAMSPVAIGGLVNLSSVSGLPSWASTLMLLGGVIGLVLLLIPKR